MVSYPRGMLLQARSRAPMKRTTRISALRTLPSEAQVQHLDQTARVTITTDSKYFQCACYSSIHRSLPNTSIPNNALLLLLSHLTRRSLDVNQEPAKQASARACCILATAHLSNSSLMRSWLSSSVVETTCTCASDLGIALLLGLTSCDFLCAMIIH
uniref:Uncharacterized protein n=1 Tax=Guillardia theta TaxID=55529 RepID=A0A7S4U8H8_GUITH|mmetsp:Transcript_41126/g.129178  ORF Transcript_41126/g.129178 Transcript_41126/m.129178 type:complete len:157 (+) Transcript_41126:222-692(+)